MDEQAEAAKKAVGQWRFRPVSVNGKPIRQFVVVLEFDRHEKVRLRRQ